MQSKDKDEVKIKYKESPRRFKALAEDRQRKERLKEERMAEAKQILDKMFEAAIRCGGYIESCPPPLPC
jgi:hypothetical protein